MGSDFNYGILAQTRHRPWPVPDSPWIMTQTWNDLLFAHWPIDAAALQRRMPASLPPDIYDGQAWLGIVPFHMTNVAPRGVPNLPFVSAFPELNVRTYVTVAGRPGVVLLQPRCGKHGGGCCRPCAVPVAVLRRDHGSRPVSGAGALHEHAFDGRPAPGSGERQSPGRSVRRQLLAGWPGAATGTGHT